MRISELLEATFQGEPCTKDCSGHSAGYQWAMKNANKNCNSKNKSFNSGCNIAKGQMAAKRQPQNQAQELDTDEEV